MAKLRVSLGGQPLLDIASYARRGPGRHDRLTLGEVALISRTVRRVPEAVVKVLSRDSNKLASVGKHLSYIGRHGELDLETDEGEQLRGWDLGRLLIADWDLDMDEHRRTPDLAAASGRAKPKLVHKLMFSMPPGTPPQGVLAAARNLLREEFALKHRYAFVLHTDEPHPHVHAVVKATSEQGERLHIKKATLREWRSEFARHLREQGIEANATERAVRGNARSGKRDGIYRANLRGDSSYMRAQVESVAKDMWEGEGRVDAGNFTLNKTRKEIIQGWSQAASSLTNVGQHGLAQEVGKFIATMPAPRTDRATIAIDWIRGRIVPRRLSKERAR